METLARRNVVLLACLGALAFPASAGLLSDNCFGGGSPPCNDQVPSLGRFIVHVTDPTFFSLPGVDPTSHLFMSPQLFDPATLIGRSTVFQDGSAPASVNIGTGANALVGIAGDPSVNPFASNAGQNEIHTAVLTMNLTNGAGFGVRAGAAMNPADKLNSLGEVETLPGHGVGTDFPASSFFDIFVDVDIQGLGTLHNTSGNPLVVQNGSIPQVPPNVIYVHGSSTAVPIQFDSAGSLGPFSWNAGDVLGTLFVAGHGVNMTQGQGTQFDNQFKQIALSDPGIQSLNGGTAFVNQQLGPEPGTWAMLFGGVALLSVGRLRRRR